MAWDAYIVLGVRKTLKLGDILERNNYPREDSLVFSPSTEIASSRGIQLDDLIDEYEIYEGTHITALTSGDLGYDEDMEDNLFTEYLFDEFYGLQSFREAIFDGDVIVLYMYDN
jgi:hypothetical protein